MEILAGLLTSIRPGRPSFRITRNWPFIERDCAMANEHGSFSSVDDLLDVPGVGPAKLSQLRERATV